MQVAEGRPALSIETTLETSRPLGEFDPFICPLAWPSCPTTGLFFKSMNPAPPADRLPILDRPDAGWSHVLEEVVDFSYGHDPTGQSRLTTYLKFVYFKSDSAVGCTYDLESSVRNNISVDRGYLLVEDLPTIGKRRLTTLKQVAFTRRLHAPTAAVCSFWSESQALAVANCAGHGHQGGNCGG